MSRKRKAPPPGYTMAELAEEAGVVPRTIYGYTRDGLLHKAEPRGRHTRYDKLHLAKLRAIAALREEVYNMPVEDVRERLSSLTDRQLLERAFPAEFPPAPPPAPPPAAPAAAAPPPRDVLAAASNERAWRFQPLVPGLVLLVKVDAGEIVERLAREIEKAYATSAPRADAFTS